MQNWSWIKFANKSGPTVIYIVLAYLSSYFPGITTMIAAYFSVTQNW